MLDHMLSVLNKAWKKEQSQIVSASNQRGLIESGDKRCDSPGHNVKYLTHFFFFFLSKFKKGYYSFFGTSNWSGGCFKQNGKAGLIKVLDEVKQKNLKVDLKRKNLKVVQGVFRPKKYLREQE